MERQRKRYSAEFKAKVALAAARGQKTLSELAEQYAVHADRILCHAYLRLFAFICGSFFSSAQRVQFPSFAKWLRRQRFSTSLGSPAKHQDLGFPVVLQEDDILAIRSSVCRDAFADVLQADTPDVGSRFHPADPGTGVETEDLDMSHREAELLRVTGVGDEQVIAGEVNGHGLAGRMARGSLLIRSDDLPAKLSVTAPMVVAANDRPHGLPVLVLVFAGCAAEVHRVGRRIIAKTLDAVQFGRGREGLH